MTDKPIKADDVFVDWTIANFLKDGSVADGRYTYHNFENSPQAQDTEEVTKCPQGQKKKVVQQYGVDYIRISCEGQYTLNFQGETTVGVLPENALSGDYSFWSNKGDESDMTLTQEFDFTGVSGDLTLNYWTWYDLEVDYDYLYLEVSEDGQKWEIITTPDCTTEDPSGNSYGCGYNGVTDSWVEQKIDLTPWAGKKVQLRFEYITDAAVNGEGFLLDDVSIPAIGYATDFETDNGGWQAAGWVRIENKLPQTYRVTLIRMGAETTVIPVELSAEQNFSLPLNIAAGEEVVLVVSGTTRFTRMPAFYYIEIK